MTIIKLTRQSIKTTTKSKMYLINFKKIKEEIIIIITSSSSSSSSSSCSKGKKITMREDRIKIIESMRNLIKKV